MSSGPQFELETNALPYKFIGKILTQFEFYLFGMCLSFQNVKSYNAEQYESLLRNTQNNFKK